VVDLMTADPVALSPWDTIQQADELMNEHRIRQLPVVADAELVGIITARRKSARPLRIPRSKRSSCASVVTDILRHVASS
ncbi:MAG TPA: CBS domain-containing protein, partial [Candidatus Acidoferrales bacterium]|nr:CBS domain-containing protein [Candidatus Acidoferrales bacterium]